MMEIASFKGFDLSGYKLPIIAVYQHPDNFPDECIGRLYDINRPTPVYIRRDTVGEVIDDVDNNTRLVFIPRGDADVPSMIGCFL